jgi:uncharacterized damage-inducible protein DinB
VKKKDFIEIMRQTQAPIPAMVEMVPDDKLDWAPAEGFMNMGQLLKHMSENWSILKMMITKEWPFSNPDEMTEAMKLENMPSCSKSEAIAAMKKDLDDAAAYMESGIGEEEFFTKEVTAPWGFTGGIWQAFLMAKEHHVSHRMQLHTYLKLLGQPVNTGTLYGM